MYSGEFSCSLIINKCRKRFEIIVQSFVPKVILIQCTSHRVEHWFHCGIYFGTICHHYQRLRLLYGFPTMWLAYIHRSVRLPVQDMGIVGQFELDNPTQQTDIKAAFVYNSSYIKVCVISANLARNRVRLIHDIDLYMRLYGKYITRALILAFI